MITTQIVADSINLCGNRITTFLCTYPRFIHSELMTHRMFSRNAASSRAIPVEKMLKMVIENPAMPESWGKNQKGMQAEQELLPDSIQRAKNIWLRGRDFAVEQVQQMLEEGVHKQIANRMLETYAHMTVLVTATEYENFFALRAHKDAQPEFMLLADRMLEAYNASEPKLLGMGEWHIPFGDEMPLWIPIEEKIDGIIYSSLKELTLEDKLMIASARCARLSYLTQDGETNYFKDIQLFTRLRDGGHWSPMEHCAMNLSAPTQVGNFVGWLQYRKTFQQENRRDSRVIKKVGVRNALAA